jgi:frataxin-like iron-binding protein CyaY
MIKENLKTSTQIINDFLETKIDDIKISYIKHSDIVINPQDKLNDVWLTVKANFPISNSGTLTFITESMTRIDDEINELFSSFSYNEIGKICKVENPNALHVIGLFVEQFHYHIEYDSIEIIFKVSYSG